MDKFLIKQIDPKNLSGDYYYRQYLKTLSFKLCWVAETGSEQAAYSFLTQIVENCPGDLWLGPTWVHEPYRRQGLQRKLIQVRQEYAKERNLSLITNVLKDNLTSENNLKACGFTLFKETKIWNYYTWNLELS